MKINIRVTGIEKALASFDVNKLNKEVDKVSETYARKMANAAAARAPRKNGWLKKSIIASVRQERMGVWSFGSDLEYARKQEYTNPTKRGFIRLTIYEYEREYQEAVRELLRQIGAM